MSPNWPENYQAAYRMLGQSIVPTHLRLWIQPLQIVESGPVHDFGQSIEFLAPNEFAANWVRDHYLHLIETAFSQVTGTPHSVKISFTPQPKTQTPNLDSLNSNEDQVQPSLISFQQNDSYLEGTQKKGAKAKALAPIRDAPAPREDSHPPSSETGSDLLTSLPTVSIAQSKSQHSEAILNPALNFDTFIVGSSNQFAHASAIAVADQPASQFNPLFIYSRPGLGKTHLLHAIGNRIRSRNPAVRIGYLSAELFLNEVIECLQTKRMAQFRTKYRDSFDILMIDDIQFIAGKNTTEEEFFHTFNTLHSAKKQIVITSDRPPKEIEKLEERMRTRFEWGMVVDIQPPDIETRIAILKSKAEREDIYLPDDVATFLATHVKTNIRELEGHLVKLQMQASFTGSEISLDMVKQQLKTMVPEEGPKYTVEMIQNAVARHYQIRTQDFKSATRAQKIALPRQVAMYLVRRYTGLGYNEIGTYFGDRDRTTVMHACEKIEASLEDTQEIKRAIETIQTLL